MSDGGMALEGVEDAFLMNASQLGMLFHSLSEPGTGVYVGVFSALLPKDLDIDLFQKAWSHVIARHDALRSLFVWEGVDDPLQVVRTECEIAWEFPDQEVPSNDGGPDLAYVEMLRREGVDLSAAPAMRFILARLDTGARCMFWVCHHALIDDWSQALVLSEVQTSYRSFLQGETPSLSAAPPFSSFVQWLESRDTETHEAFWRDLFAGFSSPTRVQPPRSQHDDSNNLRGASERWLDQQASDALRQLASSQRTTLASVATAIWSVVLHRLSGEDDLAFGLAATQRPPEIGGIERAVGNFVTTMPARVAPGETPTLDALISRCHDMVQEAQPRLGLSLTRLNEILGVKSDTPLFDTILSINHDALAVLNADEAPLFGAPSTHFKSSFPLAMVVMPGDRIGLRLVYDARAFDADTVKNILDLFEHALSAAPSSLGMPPSILRVMSEQDESEALAGLASNVSLPPFAGVVEEIRKQAKAHPDRIAVSSGGVEYSYRALVERAEAIAHQLQGYGLGTEHRVGVYLDRSVDVPLAMLGCLMAGVGYVPFDAAFPEKRLERMVAAADLSAVLTCRQHFGRLAGQSDRLIDLDEVQPETDLARSLPDVDGAATAYVMFTSGSTGAPKGVLVSRANLDASTSARLTWYDDQPRDYLLLSSHAFDSSVAGIYWTLVAGGTLHIAAQHEAQDVTEIAGLIRDRNIGHTLCLPSLYHLLLDTAPESLGSLKAVIVAGEEATPELVVDHLSSGLKARLFNEYGPTEATVWCAAAELTAKDTEGPVQIGGPTPGTTLYIRDAKGRPVPRGLVGDLYVGGTGVATGYLGLPEETAHRFVTDVMQPSERLYKIGDLVRQRSDGALVYLGRADEQVKLRGYRIELSEIESVLASRPDVREAAVSLVGKGVESKLVAFIVAKETAQLSPKDLASFCKSVLPAYMIPARFVSISELPRLPNGKIDRSGLTAPKTEDPGRRIVESSTQTESVLVDIWRQTLWLDRKVGVNEDFTDLGGHSLLAMRLVNEIERAFDLRIPVSRLGPLKTIADQALLIEQVLQEKEADGNTVPHKGESVPSVLSGLDEAEERKLRSLKSGWDVPEARPGSRLFVLNKEGKLPPLFFCCLDKYSFTQLAAFLGSNQPIYAIRGANGIVQQSGQDLFTSDMRRTAITHLEEVMELAGDRPIQLAGYCQGAMIALHLAGLLTVMGRSVSTVIAIEHSPTISFSGHVDILFTEDSFLNPYLNFEHPELAWSRRFGSHSFRRVPGDYGKVFRPPYIIPLSEAVRDCLSKARGRALVSLPRSARKIAWDVSALPAQFSAGVRMALPVSFRNEGDWVWKSTEASGLRVRADLFSVDDEVTPVATSHATLETEVSPGQDCAVELFLDVPEQAGSYRLEIDMVEEGVVRFSKAGNSPASLLVIVDADADPDPRFVALETDNHGEHATRLGRDPAVLEENVLKRLSLGSMNSGELMQTAGVLEGEAKVALSALGTSGLQRTDPDRAERFLRARLAMTPGDPAALVALAGLKLTQRQPIAAFRYLLSASRLGSSEAKSMLSMHFSPVGVARHLKRHIMGVRGAK